MCKDFIRGNTCEGKWGCRAREAGSSLGWRCKSDPVKRRREVRLDKGSQSTTAEALGQLCSLWLEVCNAYYHGCHNQWQEKYLKDKMIKFADDTDAMLGILSSPVLNVSFFKVSLFTGSSCEYASFLGPSLYSFHHDHLWLYNQNYILKGIRNYTVEEYMLTWKESQSVFLI